MSKMLRRYISLLAIQAIVCIYTAAWSESQPIHSEAVTTGDQKNIIGFQSYRQSSAIQIKDESGKEGTATLIQLNPSCNDWYVIQLSWQDGVTGDYHLENNFPQSQKLLLDQRQPAGIMISQTGKQWLCQLWGAGVKESLKAAKTFPSPYAPLCGGRVYLRNSAKGHQTTIEKTTQFLRTEIPAGDAIVNIIRDTFFSDVYREEAETAERKKSASSGSTPGKTIVRPQNAHIDPDQADEVIESSHLGIDVQEPISEGITPGYWYPAKDNPGIYVSLITPGLIAREVLQSHKTSVNTLDQVESDALVYLIAFDLEHFDLKFSLGTNHPGVGWSDRTAAQMRDPSLPGPDGFGRIAPLVSTGLVNPMEAGRAVATFVGGFKRTHGAFRWGALAAKNHGSHYGFIEAGVVFSKLQPGLSTIYVLRNGRVNMKTWTEEDNRLLPEICYARQNGVPIISGYDATAKLSIPGALVNRWGEGNWSGSADERLRTMRAGAALQEMEGKRFLIYAVFTGATPSAMARVFQAYGCIYAMHLDMNALELTYLAVYKRKAGNLYVQHLIQGMSQSDVSKKGQYFPRFLELPDNRDFFTVLQKEAR